MMWMLMFIVACVGDNVLPALAPPQAEVSVTVEEAKVPSGQPVIVRVETLAVEGWSFDPVVPYSEGLTVELVSEEGPTVVDDRLVHAWRYALSGEDGSYVIATTNGHASGPEEQTREFESTPLFVDIGVPGPTGGPMDGFASQPVVEPAPIRPFVWLFVCIAVLAALFWWWKRRRKPVAEPPPIPAHILAQGAWADARSTIRDDHTLAVRLSMILREYIEARASIPASKATTAEIWEGLAIAGIDGRPITDSLRSHIAQILDATDRLKFAREGGGDGFFQSLDKHFQTIINETRPRPPADESDDA